MPLRQALVSTLGAHLVSEHSLAEQDEIMVNGLCPQAENVAECEEQLPNFWESIAVVLWPAYYSPEVHILTRRGFSLTFAGRLDVCWNLQGP